MVVKRRARRGVLLRFAAMVLGAAIAVGGVVVMQLPLLHSASHAQVGRISSGQRAASPLAWPAGVSAAVDIPSLSYLRSENDSVVPIASLTKMMTAFVTLSRLPLQPGESGPCWTVTATDVATYQTMLAENQSSAAVTAGEQLCEFDLLEGLLVHSAGNYAVMLAELVAGSTVRFVTWMNDEATRLGLGSTHYADVSGFSPQSVSSASDQARLAVRLMRSPVVRSIVVQPSVTLPVAGRLYSYTPFVGVDHVIGVKSGRTSEAGGCDVLALQTRFAGRFQTIYAVILGARGGDLLGPAGSDALALADSVLANRRVTVIPRHAVVGRIGWPGHMTPVQTAHRLVVSWWALRTTPSLVVRWRTFHRVIRRGELVGWLRASGTNVRPVAIRARARVAPSSLLERLR